MMLFPSIFNDNLFDDFMDFPVVRRTKNSDVNHLLTGNMNTFMKTDIKEHDDHYELEIDLPGYDKNDVGAEIKDGYLTITANRTENRDEKDQNGKYLRRERYSGSMSRSFYVGDEMTEEDIKASFKNGTLLVNVPKKEPVKEVPEKHVIAIEG